MKILTVSNVADNSLWFLCYCSFEESSKSSVSLILKGGPLLSVALNVFYILLCFPLFVVSKPEVFQKLMDRVERINDGY